MVMRVIGRLWQHVGLCAALWLSCSFAHADKVHLAGGSVIEGKVQRVGDKIVIELDSGSVRLDAASVVRIEKGQSAFERIEAERAALPKGAVAERLTLANTCHEQSLPQCERELLREILALEPDHAEARARLGYVHTDKGWITREEELRAQRAAASAKRNESQNSADQVAALRRAELERDTAELTRQQAQLSLEAQRLALRAAEAQRQSGVNSSAYTTPYLYSYGSARPYGYAPRAAHPLTLRPPLSLPPPHVSTPPFGINGVRDPASYFR